MDLVMEQLESLGDPVTPVERLKVAFRREYGELVAGKALDEQKKQLKLVFEKVLLGGEERYEAQEYNARLEVLTDLLQARGSALQYTGTSLFSSIGGAESTPERPTRSSAVSVTPTAGGARSTEDVEIRILAQADELARLRRDLEEERLCRDRERATGSPGRELQGDL